MHELLLQSDHDNLLKVANNPDMVSGLSDDELLRLKDKGDSLYQFFFQMQMVTKELCNSVYGGVATNSLRYFNPNTAMDITAEGRHANQMMEKVSWGYFKNMWHKDFGFHEELREKFPEIMLKEPTPILMDPTVYGDTDSNYLCFDYLFESLGHNPFIMDYVKASDFIVYFMRNKLNLLFDRVLKKTIRDRNGESTMIFELESIGGFGIFVAKKKYVFEMLWIDGKFVGDKKGLKSTGIELAQKSVPIIARKFISFFVKHIFSKKGKITSAEFFNICRVFREKINKVHTIDFAKNNNMKTYEKYVVCDDEYVEVRPKCPAPVRGAARYNRDLKKHNLQGKYPIIRDGMRVVFWYDKDGQPYSIPTDIEFPKEFAPEMSRDIQMEKLVFAPIRRLVEGGMVDGNLNNMGREKVTKSFSTLFKK